MQVMVLQGAEDVLRASATMRQAAQDMEQSARNIDVSFRELKDFLDDWLIRYKQIMEKE